MTASDSHASGHLCGLLMLLSNPFNSSRQEIE
jgi:hypothetical protein